MADGHCHIGVEFEFKTFTTDFVIILSFEFTILEILSNAYVPPNFVMLSYKILVYSPHVPKY